MSLRSRIEKLEKPVNKDYDLYYIIYVFPDGSPYDGESRAKLADALDAREAGYRVFIEKITKPNFIGDPWKGIKKRLAHHGVEW